MPDEHSRMSPSTLAPPADATPDDVETLVRLEQHQMVVDRSRSSNLIGTPFAAVVVWLLWGAVDHRLLLAWLGLKALVSLVRIALARAFTLSPREARARWGRRFVWAIAADGAVFGLLGTLLLPTQDPALMSIMVATLLGIAAIGLVVLSMSFEAALALTLPVLLPATVMQFLRAEALSVYIGIGMLVFLGLVVVEGRRAAEHTRAMLRLRFRMDELAAQRQQALDEAERSNAVKSQFLATMSHEMRTPLHGLLGLTRLLQRDAPPGTSAAERLSILERTGEHLLTVINEVLEYSRIESGHLRLQAQGFDARALLRSVVDLMQPAAIEKGLALRLRDDLPSSSQFQGDAHRLRQIVLNLTGNALKFTVRGAVTLHARCDPQDRLLIDVIDSGPGVPVSERERIFEAFQQLDGSFARNHGGTGLGLTISRRLAQAMGGDIECLEAPGGGALFRVHLALPRVEAAAAVAPPPPAADAEVSLSGHVLLVEDNPVNALVAEAALRSLGVTVHTVTDGEQGLACARQGGYDVILMDCQMPGIDGFEATARIRDHEARSGRERVPIVALTANALSGDRQRSLAAGMDEHLAKPFRSEELGAVLRRLLRR